jgi:hypothetical protein
MSKKDFELIAGTIRTAELTAGHAEYASCQVARSQMAHAFADALAATNPRFDRARFVAACMGEDSKDSAGRKVRYSAA